MRRLKSDLIRSGLFGRFQAVVAGRGRPNAARQDPELLCAKKLNCFAFLREDMHPKALDTWQGSIVVSDDLRRVGMGFVVSSVLRPRWAEHQQQKRK